tara:strand:- start:8 stop:502 length:495 start_codon:yes stop_codon:yes gene_type:complete
MELIASYTATGSVASIDFSSIAADWTDLALYVSLRDNGSNVYSLAYVKFNNSTSNLNSRGVEGNGASATSYVNATTIYINSANGNTSTANTFSNSFIYVPNYTSSNYKSVSVDGVMENNATTAYASLQAGLWSTTSAINQITLYSTTGSWLEHSTAYLYGVKNA